jgi:UDP:flavonoid glycosyltransferase YjiC (YdhE family)
MADSRIPDANVKMAAFAKAELQDLVERLSTARPDLKVDKGSLMSALVLAAQRLPIEVIAAAETTYWNEEEERAALFAVCAFIAHLGR